MEIKNLTQEGLHDLNDFLGEMQKVNRNLNWNQFQIGDPTGPVTAPFLPHHSPTIGQFEELKEAIAALNRKFDLTFGGHVLVDGRFVDLTPHTG